MEKAYLASVAMDAILSVLIMAMIVLMAFGATPTSQWVLPAMLAASIKLSLVQLSHEISRGRSKQ
jgi:hypothetical protein